MARGLDAGKYFWRSGREKCFSLDIPFNRTSGQPNILRRQRGREYRESFDAHCLSFASNVTGRVFHTLPSPCQPPRCVSLLSYVLPKKVKGRPQP